MEQSLLNAAFAALAGIAGWILKTLWDAVSALQAADSDLAEKVNKIEVLVAGEYIKREEFQGVVNRLFEKLDNIEAKLDKKADK